MERMLCYVRLFAGTETDHDNLLDSMPTELRDAIRTAGLRDVSGFRRGTDVWWYAEAHPDRATALGRLTASDALAGWQRQLRIVVAEWRGPGGGPLLYEQVFHTDGGGTGPSTRALFGLVVDPDRIEYYDDLHAHPWPDMVDAIAASGYRNYSGFRRDNHVVYFGEYHPDMETVNDRMGRTEVNDRWNRAFEGVITRITTEEGRLITAQEVYHQD